MILEYNDIKPFLKQIVTDVRKAVESEKFLSYPKGMQQHLCDGEVSERSYQRVYNLWNQTGFPQNDKGKIKGVYLSDLKTFLKK